MKLSQKRTCNDCKARTSGINPECALGVPVEAYDQSMGVPLIRPTQPCLKPLSEADFEQACKSVSH